MSNKTYVVWSCAHATPENSNERFDWLGNFLYDVKPDVAIDLGDSGDFKSLNSYDTRYPQAIVTQSYEKDVEVYNDSMERIRRKFKENKRKRPYFVGFCGNHEKRIETALAVDPRLEGDKYGVSFKHLNTDKYFDDYHPYMKGGPEGWAGQAQNDWWTGVVVLNEVDGFGGFEPSFISLKRLKEEYS